MTISQFQHPNYEKKTRLSSYLVTWSSQFRPPCFQEKVVFRQGFSKTFAKKKLPGINCDVNSSSHDVQGPDIMGRTKVNVYGVANGLLSFSGKHPFEHSRLHKHCIYMSTQTFPKSLAIKICSPSQKNSQDCSLNTPRSSKGSPFHRPFA